MAVQTASVGFSRTVQSTA